MSTGLGPSGWTRRLVLAAVVIGLTGCGGAALPAPEVVETLGQRRGGTPPFGNYAKAAFGFRVRNTADRPMKSLLITYQIQAHAPPKGPVTSAPGPAGPLTWYDRKWYVDCDVPPGGELCVVCPEYTWLRGWRNPGFQARAAAFRPPSLSADEVADLLLAGLFQHPESPYWLDASVVSTLDAATLQQLIVRRDARKDADPYKDFAWKFESLTLPFAAAE